MPFPVGAESDWISDVERRTRDAKGRVDIVLRPSLGQAGPRQSIWIESKVGAKITARQLLKYKKDHPGHLVLVTRDRPDISDSHLRRLGVGHFRWQDLHDAVSTVYGVRGKDRFVVEQFCRYLEDLKMASESKVTRKDLQEIARIFRVFSGASTREYLKVGPGLDATSRWLNLMAEVAERLKERSRTFAQLHQWGPAYYRWEAEDGDHGDQSLGVSFWRRTPRGKRECFCYVCVGAKGRPRVEVFHLEPHDEEGEFPRLPMRALLRKGHFDPDAIAKEVLALSKIWGWK